MEKLAVLALLLLFLIIAIVGTDSFCKNPKVSQMVSNIVTVMFFATFFIAVLL